MSSRPPLWVVSTIVRSEEKDLLAKAAHYGLDACSVLVDRLLLELTGTDDGPADHAPIALLRTPGFFATGQIASLLEAEGCHVCNDTGTLARFGQKVQTDAWLKTNRLPYLPSVVAFGNRVLEQAGGTLGFPLVIKPSIGGFGQLVQVIRDMHELRNAVEYLVAYAPSSHRSIFLQRFVDIEHDLRVIVVGDRVVAAYERKLAPNGERHGPRNVAQGSIGSPFALCREDRAMIERLGQRAGAAYLGVDLLIDVEGNRFVCDVNPVCRYAEAARVTGVDISGAILAHLADEEYYAIADIGTGAGAVA